MDDGSSKSIQKNNHLNIDTVNSNELNQINNQNEKANDLTQSMGLHKMLLVQQVSIIEKELSDLIKDPDNLDFLITLVQKKIKLHTQINRIENKLNKMIDSEY